MMADTHERESTGSCLGAATRLLKSKPEAFHDFDLPASSAGSVLANAGYLYGLLASFLVTHAHWGTSSSTFASPAYIQADRCAWGRRPHLRTSRRKTVAKDSVLREQGLALQGLVLSCGSAASKSQKSVYGSKQTLANLSEAMNGGLWPVLGSYTESKGMPYVWRLCVPIHSLVPPPGAA